MFEKESNEQMILLDCLSLGIPWPESRKVIYKGAPEECRIAQPCNGNFFYFEQVNEVEKESMQDLATLERAFTEMDDYTYHPKSGIRTGEGDKRLLWYSGCERSGSAMHFYLADLREHKIKVLYHRQCWSAYHSVDHYTDEIAALLRYYSRVLHTFRRIKFIKWTKITARDGRVKIHIFNEKATYPNPSIQLAFEKAMFREDQQPKCDLLHGDIWKAWPHVRDRIDFWRLEETGELTDEAIAKALESDDEILVSWAVGYLRSASEEKTVELIRKQISSRSLVESKAAVRTAGRLWLKDLEQDVMRQYNLRGNAIGPAVAEFIGSLGVTGRSFLPKILRALTRRGDFATLIPTIRALGAFPHSTEAKALPTVLSILLGLIDDVEPILERFPGIRTDVYGPQDPPILLQKPSLESLREESVHAIIETTAHYSDAETFDAIARQISVESPYMEKLLFEIEKYNRADAADALLTALHAASQHDPAASAFPLTRRAVMTARTLLRVSVPEDRTYRLIAALHHISAHVGSYRRDSEIGYNYHIENFPSEPYITLTSIIKGLPEEKDLVKELLKTKDINEKEKYLIQQLAAAEE